MLFVLLAITVLIELLFYLIVDRRLVNHIGEITAVNCLTHTGATLLLALGVQIWWCEAIVFLVEIVLLSYLTTGPAQKMILLVIGANTLTAIMMFLL